jgi:hypothetical protein
MFLESFPKPIDSQLQEFVKEIEAQSRGFSVLAARQFRYEVKETPVQITFTEPRPFNMLEEFILRAGIELEPRPTVDELAFALGLDRIFVENSLKTLRDLQTLDYHYQSKIQVTSKGDDFYQKRSLPQEKQETLYAIANPLTGSIGVNLSPLESSPLELPDLKEFLELDDLFNEDGISLTLEKLQSIVRDSGYGFHIPEEGKIVKDFQLGGQDKAIWQSMSIFVLFDAIEDKIKLQVRDGAEILEAASSRLMLLQEKQQVCLSTLCQLEDEQIARERQLMLDRRNRKVDRRLDKIKQEVIAELKQTESSENVDATHPDRSETTGTATQLRDGDIREVFLNTLESANQMILIFSPWVNKDVLDNQFINQLKQLAQRGVWILLGYGICQTLEKEKPIPEEVEKKLAKVKTAEGLSAVQIVWLGNSHAKEVVVDRRIHLSGSHNWLSYRGDRLPRGETVYQVTIPNQVDKAYRHLASRFENHAKSLWQQAVTNKDASLATTSLCIWGALGMEEMALQEIEKKQWLDLLPIWLKVACQGLRSQQLSPDSDCFPQALSLLSQLDPSFSHIKALGKGWQKAIALIASGERAIAIQLLSEPVWSDFIRLGIVLKDISSPEDFISAELAKLPKIKKTVGKKRKGQKSG